MLKNEKETILRTFGSCYERVNSKNEELFLTEIWNILNEYEKKLYDQTKVYQESMVQTPTTGDAMVAATAAASRLDLCFATAKSNIEKYIAQLKYDELTLEFKKLETCFTEEMAKLEKAANDYWGLIK